MKLSTKTFEVDFGVKIAAPLSGLYDTAILSFTHDHGLCMNGLFGLHSPVLVLIIAGWFLVSEAERW